MPPPSELTILWPYNIPYTLSPAYNRGHKVLLPKSSQHSLACAAERCTRNYDVRTARFSSLLLSRLLFYLCVDAYPCVYFFFACCTHRHRLFAVRAAVLARLKRMESAVPAMIFGAVPQLCSHLAFALSSSTALIIDCIPHTYLRAYFYCQMYRLFLPFELCIHSIRSFQFVFCFSLSRDCGPFCPITIHA